MSNRSTTIGRVRTGVDDVVEKAREVVNEGLDAAKQRFDHAADRLERRYHKTMLRARGRAERATKALRARVAVARNTLAKGYTEAGKKLSRLDRNARRYVNDNPRKAVLIATGVGLLAGLVVGRVRRGHAAG